MKKAIIKFIKRVFFLSFRLNWNIGKTKNQ